jgi:hypothetical protein
MISWAASTVADPDPQDYISGSASEAYDSQIPDIALNHRLIFKKSINF